MLNCSVDLKKVRKDALNPKSYNLVFVSGIIFDLLEPENSFVEGSPYMQVNSIFLSISKP